MNIIPILTVIISSGSISINNIIIKFLVIILG